MSEDKKRLYLVTPHSRSRDPLEFIQSIPNWNNIPLYILAEHLNRAGIPWPGSAGVAWNDRYVSQLLIGAGYRRTNYSPRNRRKPNRKPTTDLLVEIQGILDGNLPDEQKVVAIMRLFK